MTFQVGHSIELHRHALSVLWLQVAEEGTGSLDGMVLSEGSLPGGGCTACQAGALHELQLAG